MTLGIDQAGWSIPRGTVLETLASALATVYDPPTADRLTYEIGAVCDACHQLLGVPDKTQLRIWAKRQQRPMTAPLGAQGVGQCVPVPDITPGRQIGKHLQDASIANWLWLHPRHHWRLCKRGEFTVELRPSRP